MHSVQGRTALEAEYKSSPYGMRKYVGPPSVRDHQLVKFKALFFFHAKRRATSAALGGVAAKCVSCPSFAAKREALSPAPQAVCSH